MGYYYVSFWGWVRQEKGATEIALLSEREGLVNITGESGNAVLVGYLRKMALPSERKGLFDAKSPAV